LVALSLAGTCANAADGLKIPHFVTPLKSSPHGYTGRTSNTRNHEHDSASGHRHAAADA
jgi:hypothetical protein